MTKKRRSGSRGAKRGKKTLSMADQATRWIHARANRGQPKSSGKHLRCDRTVERYRGDLARAATWIAQHHGITQLNTITQAQAQDYLDHRKKDNLRAKTLQGYAMALKTLPRVNTLDVPSRRDDPNDKSARSRAY